MNESSNSRGIRRDVKVTATNVTAIFVLVAAGIAILLGLLNYPVIGHDAYVHLNWLYQFPKMFADGVPYPRWLPGSFGGFGAPTFYYYAPLVYWVAGGVRLAGLTAPQSLYQVIQLSFTFLALFTSYTLIRQCRASKRSAFLGALVYSVLAYNFCDVFIRDALTEHAASAFLPLIFLRFPNRLREIVVVTIGWTGLLLTNLPVTYIAAMCIAVMLIARGSWKESGSQASALAIAIAASATYLFPAFAMRALIHQRHLFDLPMNTSQFGFAVLDLFQGHFDWLRILSIVTLVAAILLLPLAFSRSDHPLLFKEGDAGWLREWRWIVILGIFFQLPFVSAPFWHLIPGMPFVQFSWRWNGVLLLAIAIIASYEHSPPARSSIGRGGALGNCILIGLAVVTIVSGITISRNLFTRPPLAYNSYLMDAPEYATKWAASDPSEVIGITLRRMNDPAAVLLGLTMVGDSVSLRSQAPTQWNFTSHLTRPTPVRFHQFYWPYWKAFAGDSELTMRPDPNGFATALLPAGNDSIILRLVESPIEKLGGRISEIGFFLLFVLTVLVVYRWITTGRETTVPPELTRKI